MKTIISIIVGALLLTSVANAEDIATATNKTSFIDDVVENVTGAVDEIADSAIPIIQEKAGEIWKDVQGQVDKGFLQLSTLTNEVDSIVAELETELDNIVSSNDMIKIDVVLDIVSGQVIDIVVDQLADVALEALDIPVDKIKAVDQILSKDIEARGELLDKYVDQGTEGLEKFSAENQAMLENTVGQLKGLLTPEEVEAVEAWFDETEKKIDEMFAEKKE